MFDSPGAGLRRLRDIIRSPAPKVCVTVNKGSFVVGREEKMGLRAWPCGAASFPFRVCTATVTIKTARPRDRGAPAHRRPVSSDRIRWEAPCPPRMLGAVSFRFNLLSQRWGFGDACVPQRYKVRRLGMQGSWTCSNRCSGDSEDGVTARHAHVVADHIG